MLKSKVKLHASRILIILTLLLLLPIPTAQAQANTISPPPEPYTQLYVVYNHPELKTFSIELRNQRRNLDGSVTAQVAVRSEGLIAYNLTFNEFETNAGYLKDIDFLPLYPSHVYEIATITIKPSGQFTIQGTKFGLEESVLPKMTLVQMCILVMHLIGAKPPVDTYELAESIPEAFDTVIGPIGVFANIASAGFEIFGKEPKPTQAVISLGDAISESDSGADTIASGINLITKSKGIQATGSLVKKLFNALNVLEITNDIKRSFDAYQQLQNYPNLLTATISLVPEIVELPDRYRVFEINQVIDTEIVFKNTSGEVWSPEQGYELWVMLESIPLENISLSTIIPRGKESLWKIQQSAPSIPGIYHLRYQLAIKGQPIGLPIKAEIVVVPEKSNDLQDMIDAMVDDAKREAGERFDEYVADLERRITEAITNEILRRLQEICGGTGVMVVIGGLPMLNRWRTRSRKRV
jgi:hypothetical protein